MDVLVEDGVPLKILPAKDYQVNFGKTCTKGFNLIKGLEGADRGVIPLFRDRVTGKTKELNWDEAAATFVQRIKAIQKEHGPESVAFLSTGQMPFEEMALLGSVTKFGMGFRHGDGNTRQCMATAAVAYKQAFGFDAPGFSYEDLEVSDAIVLIGANPSIAHPIFWQRLKNNQNSPEIVVIDPRATETVADATRHLAIHPKSDLTLLYTIAHILIERNWLDQGFIDAHTSGFDEFAAHVKPFTPEAAVGPTGLSISQMEGLAELFHTKKAVSLWWTMGVNQSHQGVRTAQAIINLSLMTGHIGRPGAGPNSITGQANAMGSRLFSNTTSLLGGHYFEKPEHRAKVARILGINESQIPPDAGMSYDQILEAVETGAIKALWIICTNPAHSWVDQTVFRTRLKKLDFLVVQDVYASTETAQLADLYLPAAGSAEKTGTFINSERRLGIVQKVKEAPGQALSDFEIFRRLGAAWGVGSWLDKWSSPPAAFELLKEISRGQPCDFSELKDWNELLERGGYQWGGKRLFEDGRFFTADERAKFWTSEVVPLPEVPDTAYPFFLLTGRGTMHQWHTQTRTGKVEMLKKMYPVESYAEIHPDDANRLGIVNGVKVRIAGRRGEVVVNAQVKPSVKPGYVFLPMHYPEGNYLTYPMFDPYSRQPSYKFGAVKVERA